MNNEGKRPGGRPTLYSEELAQRICELVTNTPKSLNTLYEENDWFPASATLYRWEIEKPAFKEMYMSAKRRQVNTHVQETVKIADETLEEIARNPRIAMAIAHAQKLRCDTRHWYATKLAPRIYGDKPEADEPVKTEHMSEADKLKKIAEIATAAAERMVSQEK